MLLNESAEWMNQLITYQNMFTSKNESGGLYINLH